MELKDRIEAGTTYATVTKNSTNQSRASDKVISKTKPPNRETPMTNSDDPIRTNIRRSNSMVSIDNRSIRSVDSEGFRKPKAHVKKLRRNASAVTGSGNHNGAFKSAPTPPRELFIYRVDKETCINDISNYIQNKGIQMLDLKCMSHEDALSKSFKLKLSQEYVDALLKEDFWPSGIKVRKFIPPKPRLQ